MWLPPRTLWKNALGISQDAVTQSMASALPKVLRIDRSGGEMFLLVQAPELGRCSRLGIIVAFCLGPGGGVVGLGGGGGVRRSHERCVLQPCDK